MESQKLSLRSLKEKNEQLANMIAENYTPQLVIFIEKGGYIIGRDLSRKFNVELIGIHAEREGDRIKEKMKGILFILPDFICKFLRILELRSQIHNINNKRKVYFSKRIPTNIIEQVNDILLVDDSVDSGWSAKLAKDEIVKTFKNVRNIKVASLNVWDKSEKIIHTDYTIWRNTIVLTPMSKDSKEYNEFVKIYNRGNM